MPAKILFDTDIGSDIDDAVCLAYLLAQPECELLGITTVTGEPVERAELAGALCMQAGVDIPIVPGVATPLLTQQKQPHAPQAEALANWPHPEQFPDVTAPEFLRRIIRENPGEVVLLAVGPLTNVALLFATDPEAAGLLKGFVMMGGVFSNKVPGAGPSDWNTAGDPYATAIVYAARPPCHRSIGMDMTVQVRLTREEVEKAFQARLLEPVLDFAQIWFRNVPSITFHDPLAAVTIFDSEVCEFCRGTVEVELASPRLMGMTHWRQDKKNGVHEAAVTVDPDRFFKHYFDVLNAF